MGELSAANRGLTKGGRNGSERSAPAALTPVSWSARAELSSADWVEQGRKLGIIGRNVGWWIGDWLRYGNAAYGERYTRAARVTGYDVQTLMNMVYVASRVDASRRRAGLSWSHHAELAALDPATQERWLARAEAERFSVRCLREELRRWTRTLSAGAEAEAAGPAETEPAEQVDEGAETGANFVCQSCGHSFT